MILVLQIRGQTGSEMEFYESFLKTMRQISIIIGLEGTVMVLDVLEKFQVIHDFGSPDTGSNGVENGVFLRVSHKVCLGSF